MSGKYTIDDWRAVKKALRAGDTVRAAAARTGVGRNTVLEWGRMDEPPERMWLQMSVDDPAGPAEGGRPPNARLTYEDRVIIFALHGDGKKNRETAEAVGCHRTAVARELARAGDGPHGPRLAQRDAEAAARRPRERKLDASPELRSYVVGGLMLHWSPEQISRRIEQEFPDDPSMGISHETICQALYVQGEGQLGNELGVQIALRSGRARRRPRSKLPPRGRPWVEGREISSRPPEAADRAVPGHWEGDLVVGGDMASCLITLIERRSRFLLMSRLAVHDAEAVEQRLAEMAASIPGELRKTLTWDRGSEMAKVADFELSSDFKVYFCDPRSPWQRPTNENVNGLVREFFPKGTKFTEVSDEEVARAQWLLNNRPRKVLDWKFPSEIMQEVLAEGAMIA